MSKAEDAALRAYPNVLFPFTPLDLNAYRREAFINGYEAAEKDLALTWEDVKEIVRIADTMMDFDPHNRPEWLESDKAYYTEVLKRFNEARK